MISTAQRNSTEEAVIRRIIDGLKLPDTVAEYRLSLRNDSIGEPGVYPLFLMSNKIDEKAFLSEAAKITRTITQVILESLETERYPYPTLRYVHEQVTIDRENPGQNW